MKRSPEDLESIVGRCRIGDQRAWSQLIDHFQGLVFSSIRRCRLPEDDAAEVFHSTFVALFQHLDRIDEPKAIGRWLVTTAMRDAIRRFHSIKKQATDAMSQFGEGAGFDLPSEENLEDEVVQREEAHAARLALAKIDTRCQELLRALYSEEESSYQEITARLGITMGSIGPTRARCIEKLRKVLKQDGFFEDVSESGRGDSLSVGKRTTQ